MLQNHALLATFTAKQWTARKLDKTITDEVNSTHAASNDAGRYNKLLIAKEYTQQINLIAGRARQFHYENTLPWGDNNERLLPTKNYFIYLGKMIELKNEFDSAVTGFIGNYPATIEDARRRLNGMFKESDYPSLHQIQDKFEFGYLFMPVPDNNDIRIDLQDDEVVKIKAEIEKAVNARLSDAVRDIWLRVKEVLAAMRDKLRESDKVFRDSLFENVWEMVELLPRLNVTNDADINTICSDIKSLKYTPDQVRADASARASAANDVDAILNKFQSYFK